jgi:hypothetical protein
MIIGPGRFNWDIGGTLDSDDRLPVVSGEVWCKYFSEIGIDYMKQ